MRPYPGSAWFAVRMFAASIPNWRLIKTARLPKHPTCAAGWNPIGVTAESASTASTVSVILDDIAIIGSGNLAHQSALTPGQYYYVANVPGKLTAASAPSGITTSGLYGALSPVGLALSPSELHVEIGSPVILT